MNVRRICVLAGVATAAAATVIVHPHLGLVRESHRSQLTNQVEASTVKPPDGGPVAAALAAVTAQASLYRSGGAAAVGSDLERRAAEGAGVALVTEFARAADRVAEMWPEGPTGWWVAPLATRTTSLGPDRASVEIWLAEVVVPPTLEPYGEWRATAVELHREGGTWKIIRSTDGPAPFLRTDPGETPVSHDGMAAFLAGFEGVDHG